MNEMRIYVASLSDYNNGRLEGKWLDLADYSDASELMEAIQEMLDELTEKYKNIDGEVREEFAVHDYEGIPSTLASEYMGEQDFQQLYDIAEVADERGIPVEVLVERAGDTGSDDYQALADSLMFVVDGNDESDIVYEYESQLGNLGNDFWSNHIYIDDVTERVIYGEDVDRFREDILSENPDIDEAEAERQAEEMADEEAERREDLTTYLEDMGLGDEIPNWVSKDYEGAWKRSLSYDFDVINHDGQMYVFSSNYSLGGTILSGMIGAYIGYKVGRAKPQKKGFETEKKIGRKVKGAFTKKKMARGGNVNTGRSWHQDRRMHNKSESYEKPMSSRKKQYADGGGVDSNRYVIMQDTRGFVEQGFWGVIDKEKNELIDIFEFKKEAQGYLKEIKEKGISKADASKFNGQIDNYGKGGGIGFKGLSSKVAKRYEGKSVAPKYQGEYGKRYSKSEAKEVGDKVAGKVYAQQQGRKMAEGGFVVYAENEDGYYRKLSEHETFKGAERKQNNLWKTGEFNKMGIVPKSKWESNQYSKYKFSEGGGVDSIQIGTKIKSSSQTYVVTKKSTFGFVMEAKNGDKMIKDEYEMKQLIERGQLKIVNEEYSEGGGVDSIKVGDEVIWKGNKYLLTNITSDTRSGFYDKKYFLSSNQVGVSDAILDSLKDVKKYKYAKGGGISGLNDLIRG